MMDDHQQHLHRLRGKMAAEKETLRQQNIGELRRYKEDHGTEITRYGTHQKLLYLAVVFVFNTLIDFMIQGFKHRSKSS